MPGLVALLSSRAEHALMMNTSAHDVSEDIYFTECACLCACDPAMDGLLSGDALSFGLLSPSIS